MATRRKNRQNSASVDFQRAHHKTPPVPENFDFSSKRSAEIWRTFTTGKLYSDWNEIELFEIAKLVLVQLEIESNCKLLKKQGTTQLNGKGNIVLHPLVSHNLALKKHIIYTLTKITPFSSNREKIGEGRCAPKHEDTLKQKSNPNSKKLTLLA